MSKLRLVVLESDDVDQNTVGAIVGVLQQMRDGSTTISSIERFAAPLVSSAEDPPPALPARKKRAPKRNSHDAPSSGGRANGGGGAAVLAFLRKSPRPDLAKLAQQVYGDATKTTRAKNLINYQVRTGKARDNKDGTFTVLV